MSSNNSSDDIDNINLSEEVTLQPESFKHWYSDKNAVRLVSMATLVFLFAIVEFAFGVFTNSLALIADSFHMLSDLIALIVGFLSLRMSKRAKTKHFSYGWIRAETIGALINGVFLLSLSFYIIMEVIQRFLDPPDIEDPMLILIVGGAGLVVNIIGLIIFRGHASAGHSHGHSHSHKGGNELESETPHKKKSSNLHGVFLHVLGDALGSVGAMLSGLGIWLLPFKEKVYLDPLCSCIIAFIILFASVPLVKGCVKILMQSVPPELDLEDIEKQLVKLSGVLSVHEFHIWQLSDTKVIGTVHIACLDDVEFTAIAKQIKQILHENGVHSTTIQPEFISSHIASRNETNELGCTLKCSSSCTEQMCCTTVPTVATTKRKGTTKNGDESSPTSGSPSLTRR